MKLNLASKPHQREYRFHFVETTVGQRYTESVLLCDLEWIFSGLFNVRFAIHFPWLLDWFPPGNSTTLRSFPTRFFFSHGRELLRLNLLLKPIQSDCELSIHLFFFCKHAKVISYITRGYKNTTVDARENRRKILLILMLKWVTLAIEWKHLNAHLRKIDETLTYDYWYKNIKELK